MANRYCKTKILLHFAISISILFCHCLKNTFIWYICLFSIFKKYISVELVNSQVMLRGCETSGYVIVSAAKAKILQRLHSPVWKDRSLVSKTTWVGSFECMQVRIYSVIL